QAVVAGDVQLMYNNIATALPHVEAGKLTGLAVGGEQRFPALANVPTVAETVPGFDVTPWVGGFVPTKTPKEVVTRLSQEVEVLRKASQMGLRTLALPEDLGGVGADALTCCIVTEELAVGDADVAAVLAETSALGLRLFAAMTPEQRQRFGAAFLEDDDYHL